MWKTSSLTSKLTRIPILKKIGLEIDLQSQLAVLSLQLEDNLGSLQQIRLRSNLKIPMCNLNIIVCCLQIQNSIRIKQVERRATTNILPKSQKILLLKISRNQAGEKTNKMQRIQILHVGKAKENQRSTWINMEDNRPTCNLRLIVIEHIKVITLAIVENDELINIIIIF
jgi:hypothetical protein